MPPKKSGAAAATAAGTNDTDGNVQQQKFTWEGANDIKLLLLTQGRYVKPDEYERLAGAFGEESSTGSIRNRISKLRVQQRTLYEQHGWEVPEVNANVPGAQGGGGGGGAKTKISTPRKKRAMSGEEAAAGSPARKKGKVGVGARARAGKKEAKKGGEESDVVESEEGGAMPSVIVKEEGEEGATPSVIVKEEGGEGEGEGEGEEV